MNGKVKPVPKSKNGFLTRLKVKETSISESVHYERETRSESHGLSSHTEGLRVCHYKLK